MPNNIQFLADGSFSTITNAASVILSKTTNYVIEDIGIKLRYQSGYNLIHWRRDQPFIFLDVMDKILVVNLLYVEATKPQAVEHIIEEFSRLDYLRWKEAP